MRRWIKSRSKEKEEESIEAHIHRNQRGRKRVNGVMERSLFLSSVVPVLSIAVYRNSPAKREKQ